MATRFRDQTVEFPGTTCHTVEIERASPVNYHDAIARADELTPQPIDAKLFLPTGVSKPACVIVVPGSTKPLDGDGSARWYRASDGSLT